MVKVKIRDNSQVVEKNYGRGIPNLLESAIRAVKRTILVVDLDTKPR